jgi:integrase
VKTFEAYDADARQPFSADQIKALYAAADTEWRGMILLGAHGGLRVRDAANLKWSNIDLVKRTLSYEALKTAHRNKKHEWVTTIYLHDDVVNYLEGQDLVSVERIITHQKGACI